jgi:Tfp pilus assembly protein FimT
MKKEQMPVMHPAMMRQRRSGLDCRGSSGFSLLELTMTLAVGIVLAALAVPAVKSSVQYFRVRSAVASITGAIQSTRYRAIFDGCPSNINFNSTGNTFQVASEATSGGTCATTFANVGGAVPFGPAAVALNQNVTLQFKPSGFVQATTGTTSFTVPGSPADTLIPGNNSGQVVGIFTGSGDIQLKNGQSNGNLEIDASLATISNNGTDGLVNVGNQINTLSIVGGRIQNQIKNIGGTTRNVFFDWRFAQNKFAPPWFPSTTVQTTASNSATLTTTIQRTNWFNRTTY